MISLLGIYWFSILAATVFAGGLALVGAQLAARDRAMQTMCVGQGAMLGVLTGLGLGHSLHISELWQASLPFALALVGAGVAFLATERIVSARSSSNTFFAAIFAMLLASGYLCSALFPALENHMSQKYFGDLATIGPGASYLAAFLGVLLVVLMLVSRRVLSRDSFDRTILGVQNVSGKWTFTLLALVTLAASVQLVGFLFTTACLFIPTAILSLGKSIGLTRHLIACALVAMIACMVGFVASLWFSRLPTTPLVVFVMVVAASLRNVLCRRIGVE